MSPSVSIVVATAEATSIHDLVRSVDGQTLDVGDFELIILDAGLSEDARRSLDRLTVRRPNVKVLPAGGSWLDEAAGEYILVLREAQRLHPHGLQRLLDHALAHDLDVVAARVDGPAGGLDRALLADHQLATGLLRTALLKVPNRLVRRRHAVQNGSEVEPAHSDDFTVGAYVTYPLALDSEAIPSTVVPVRQEQPRLRWIGANLEVQAAGVVSGVSSTDLTAVVVLRGVDTKLSFLLPTTVELSEPAVDGDSRNWTLTAQFDPRDVAAGGRLLRGRHQLEVQFAGSEVDVEAAPISAGSLSPAFFDEFIVITGLGKNKEVIIDVEGSDSGLKTKLTPDDASISESAAGSLLRLTWPDANIQTSATHPGYIALDRFALPATWETSTGRLVLTSYVSGLPGTYPLSAKVANSRFRQTGLSLVIAGDGQMSTIPAPRAPKKQSAASEKQTTSKSTPKRVRETVAVARGPVARLRRALPESWEPVVRRIRNQPRARRAYQKVTGITKSN